MMVRSSKATEPVRFPFPQTDYQIGWNDALGAYRARGMTNLSPSMHELSLAYDKNEFRRGWREAMHALERERYGHRTTPRRSTRSQYPSMAELTREAPGFATKIQLAAEVLADTAATCKQLGSPGLASSLEAVSRGLQSAAHQAGIPMRSIIGYPQSAYECVSDLGAALTALNALYSALSGVPDGRGLLRAVYNARALAGVARQQMRGMKAKKGAGHTKPWGIYHSGDKWLVRRKNKETGKPFGPAVGTHPSKESAQRQIGALHANVHKASVAKRIKGQRNTMDHSVHIKYNQAAITQGARSATNYLNDAVRMIGRRAYPFADRLRKCVPYITTGRWKEAVDNVSLWLRAFTTYDWNRNKELQPSEISKVTNNVNQALRILRSIATVSERDAGQNQAFSPTIMQAAHLYLDRQARRKNPDGAFDKAGRWFPSTSERQPCCQRVRAPSRAFPYSLLTHCRSSEHVANLMNVSLSELRKAIRSLGGSSAMRRVEYLSVDIVRSLCPECADIMEQRNIKSLRADNLPPSLKAAIKEKLGTAQSGFFERCMGHDFGRSFSNKEAFCAWLRKRVTGKWPSERSASIVGKSDITKADYPLGTLKLLAQTMPKEIRALRLSHAKLVSAMTVLSHIDVPEAQDAMRDLRYIDGLVKTGIDTTTQQWKAISQQLRARGENASDIVPLYGRSASMKLRFGFGPLIVNINSEGERRKAQAQLDSVEAAIRQLQPLVRNGGQLLSSTQRALEFLQGAMDYADNAEQTIPGTQFGQLVARYGIAVRKVSSMYQILKQRITEARQELEQLDKTARQLELALAKF